MHCQVHMEQNTVVNWNHSETYGGGTTFFGYYHNLYIRMSAGLYIEFSLFLSD